MNCHAGRQVQKAEAKPKNNDSDADKLRWKRGPDFRLLLSYEPVRCTDLLWVAHSGVRLGLARIAKGGRRHRLDSADQKENAENP